MSKLKYINGIMVSDHNKTTEEQPPKVIKEDFCGACLALPLAFAGAGTATATSGGDDPNSKSNKIFWWSVALTIVGLIATFWFLRGCKSCVSTKSGPKCSSLSQSPLKGSRRYN
jgi:hypothetical protein